MADEKSADEIQFDTITAQYYARELDREHRAAYNMANENADDTSVEEKFELFSERWFYYFARTYDSVLDDMNDELAERWGF
jgi:hypothetical protein